MRILSGGILIAILIAGCDLSTDKDQSLLLSWQKTGGPDLKNIQAWTMCANTDGDLFIGLAERTAPQSSLYYSTDHGDSWHPSTIPTRYTIHGITTLPGGLVFAGAAYGTRSYFRSTDNGITFTRLTDTIPEILTLIATSDGHVLMGTYTGIYRSSDQGLTWQPVLSGDEVCTFAKHPNGDILMGGHNEIFRSTDQGATWNPVVTLGSNVFEIPALVVLQNGDMYAGTMGDGVYLSTDDGVSWNRTNDQETGNYVWALASTSDQTVYAGHYIDYLPNQVVDGIFKTSDRGQQWSRASMNIAPILVNSLVADGAGRLFAATLDVGIYRSTNLGQTWEESFGTDPVMAQQAGIQIVRLNSINTVFALHSNTGGLPPACLYMSVDGGTSWKTALARSDNINDFHIDENDRLFLGIGNQVYYSDAAQSAWNRILLPGSAGVVRLGSKQNDLYVLTQDGLLMTPDLGATWQNIPGPPGFQYSHLAVIETQDAFLVSTFSDVYRTLDRGVHWVSLEFGHPVQDLQTNNDKYYALAGDGSGVYVYNQNKMKWTAMSDGLISSVITDIVFYEDIPVIATGAGVMTWDRHSNQWVDASSGISSTSILSLALDHTGKLYAGTENGVAVGSKLTFQKNLP